MRLPAGRIRHRSGAAVQASLGNRFGGRHRHRGSRRFKTRQFPICFCQARAARLETISRFESKLQREAIAQSSRYLVKASTKSLAKYPRRT